MLAKGLQTFFNNIPATLSAMFIFLGLFLGLSVFLIWRRGAAAHYQRLAQIPFTVEEDNSNGQ
jgi:hypothetical protein